MQPDRWKTIEETFHAALQRTPEQRSTFLDEVCIGDPELRREVQSLLDESAGLQDFMEQPPEGVSLSSLDLHRPPSLEGRVLNHYRIGPLIGAGGMAEVYRARDTRLERDVAIKVLHNVQLLEPERLERMYREARLLATLNHPNIAAIYGIEEAHGVCGLVLEYIDGETLSERLSGGALSIETAIGIARQIAAGLQAAHAKGIIHRDLKPSNVKMTSEGTVKLVDFGIAMILLTLEQQPTIADISRQGMVIGTPAYMSPEQARGRAIDERTDIWAFGCVVYELLSGKPAFQGESPTDIIVKIATEDPDWNRIPRFPEAVSTEVGRLIRKCMHKDPNLRYQSVREIAADLEMIQRVRNSQFNPPTPQTRPTEDDFAVPARFALGMFLVAQAGYLALYAAASYHVDAVVGILVKDFQLPARASLFATLMLAMCGIAVRVYLISAVGWRHPAAGRKFIVLFPILLVLDGIWAAAPLLLWRHVGLGLAFAGVALLAYVPFAQRTLIRAIYPRGAVRT
jgi:serine/threonine protein kinase